jgi:hypothetical protein
MAPRIKTWLSAVCDTGRISFLLKRISIHTDIHCWPLLAVRDLTCDGRWSSYDVSVLKLSNVSFKGKCARMGSTLKIPSPTKLARLGHFPPSSFTSTTIFFLSNVFTPKIIFLLSNVLLRFRRKHNYRSLHSDTHGRDLGGMVNPLITDPWFQVYVNVYMSLHSDMLRGICSSLPLVIRESIWQKSWKYSNSE